MNISQYYKSNLLTSTIISTISAVLLYFVPTHTTPHHTAAHESHENAEKT